MSPKSYNREGIVFKLAHIFWLLLIFPPFFSKAQEKTCPTVVVTSLQISAEFPAKSSPNASANPYIAQKDSLPTSPLGSREVTITAYGPILGSMDSPIVNTDPVCAQKGIFVRSVITRSANYNGAAAQNVIWRPIISMTLVLRRREIELQTEWRMRLTTGAELDHAETPAYPELKYPITVTKTIRR
jgi:hypothetical protein